MGAVRFNQTPRQTLRKGLTYDHPIWAFHDIASIDIAEENVCHIYLGRSLADCSFRMMIMYDIETTN